ncbi:Uu.00g056750.m01.CDS01 [Anthostomella pinea]|uniref:Uu.00g056750.m01.CDS01 n=1 Tax=Anthostomella pinea TaxID=933095 RepID=A0AAI8VL06_9PEZI|nr:Uu.00g056750.m01.CDS01 [Anthostomella pinea]
MDHDSEKAKLDFDQLEKEKTENSNSVEEYDALEAKRIMRQIDRRLVVTVGAMYCVSLTDRTNLSAAAIAGMLEELNLIDNRYSIITLVFFVSYVIFQPPSTVIVRKLGPRIHLAFITSAWGLVMIGMGFVQDYKTLTALRVILGLFEAGFFPSCVYLLSTWYTRYEVGRRYSAFYVLGAVVSAFGGILAFGLEHLDGAGGLSGWRWIFIVEGIITTVLGIAGYWLLVDFPDSTRKSWRFLSDPQRAWVVRRVNADRGDVATPKFKIRRFLGSGLDWKVWAYGLIAFGSTTMSYAIAYFLPIILNKNLGFDVGASQCLVAPPYAFAGIFMYGMGWLGDKYHVRGPIIIGNMVVCLIGLPILGWHPNPKIRYLGVFFLAAGANSNVPASLAYQANNIRGQWKRAFASATWVGFSGVGGIAGSLVFRSQDAATGYKPGLWACIACCLLNILLVCICDLAFYFENKKADRGEKELETSKEDFQPGFRYTY